MLGLTCTLLAATPRHPATLLAPAQHQVVAAHIREAPTLQVAAFLAAVALALVVPTWLASLQMLLHRVLVHLTGGLVFLEVAALRVQAPRLVGQEVAAAQRKTLQTMLLAAHSAVAEVATPSRRPLMVVRVVMALEAVAQGLTPHRALVALVGLDTPILCLLQTRVFDSN